MDIKLPNLKSEQQTEKAEEKFVWISDEKWCSANVCVKEQCSEQNNPVYAIEMTQNAYINVRFWNKHISIAESWFYFIIFT